MNCEENALDSFCVTASQTDVFSPKSINSWFTFINEKDKEKILPFKKQQPTNISLKNY